MVQGWCQGGISVFDWTDPAHPKEIAFFDRGPVDSTKLASGGSWSAYWYNGYIYSSEIARGLDIFELKAGPLVSQNEIDAAKLVHLDFFNTQDQPKLVWPASFAVARAYLDHLARSKGQASQLLKVVARGRQLIGRAFLLHVTRFVVDRRHRAQKALEVEHAATQLHVAGTVGDDVLEMEGPVEIAILLEISHRVSTAHHHVADIELQPYQRWLETPDEDVIGHGAVDRRHVIGLVVERQPDTCAPGDGSRRVETIGPFAPVVERALRVRREARDDEILVPQELRRLEASLPPNQDDRGRHVRRRRAEPLGLQRGGDLRGRAAKVAERPEELDVGVADRADRGERALGITSHRVAHGV